VTQEQAQERCKANARRCTPTEPRRRWERLRHPRPEGIRTIGPDGVPNLYPGSCVSCREPVPSFHGEVVLEGRRTAVICPACRMGGLFTVAVRRGCEV
jgi:hypothetical protein